MMNRRDAAHAYRLLQAQALIDSCAKAGTGQRPAATADSTRHGDGASAAGTRGHDPPKPPLGAGVENRFRSGDLQPKILISVSDLHGASCISRRI